MQDIEKIQTRAALSDNPATTIKSGVRTLLSNPSRIRGYSDDEVAALQDAADRGIVGSTLHVMGSRLWPMVGSALGEGIGGIPGAAVGGGIAHAGSTIARNAAGSLQANRLANVLKTMGSNVPDQ
jgi:hypothetical protein